MSYDLMVFEPSAAPRERATFKEWYRLQTEWSEPHSYNNPANTSANLRAWYSVMNREFPDMNPHDGRPVDEDSRHLTDYSIGNNVIYAAFAWSVAEEAYSAVRLHAVGQRVGFYDASGDEGDGEIYFPGDALRPESSGAWRDIAAQFRAHQRQEEE